MLLPLYWYWYLIRIGFHLLLFWPCEDPSALALMLNLEDDQNLINHTLLAVNLILAITALLVLVTDRNWVSPPFILAM